MLCKEMATASSKCSVVGIMFSRCSTRQQELGFSIFIKLEHYNAHSPLGDLTETMLQCIIVSTNGDNDN